MLQPILISLGIIAYLVMAFSFFTQWLEFFNQDIAMTSEQRFFSMIILVIGTTLWPIVVPFAYLELLKAQKKKRII
jgi:uncharacterized protein with PQ loop repeat